MHVFIYAEKERKKVCVECITERNEHNNALDQGSEKERGISARDGGETEWI